MEAWRGQHSIPEGVVTAGSSLAELTACAQGTGSAATVSHAQSLFVNALASSSYGSGYGWVDWLNQQGQQQSYWCGPAVVAEFAQTMANSSRLWTPVSQSTAASYMGTTTGGTDAGPFTDGLNYCR